MSQIISLDFYKQVRSKLTSDENKTIKIGVQQMLHQFELGNRFERYNKKSENDFNAHLHYILKKTDDSDVRKWVYHLLCHYKPNDDNKTLNCCFENIAKENCENVSWIAALSATHARTMEEYQDIIDANLSEYLTSTQIRVCASSYRDFPFWDLHTTNMYKLVDSCDTISQIWLTKIFANNIRLASKKYLINHDNVTEDVIAALFYNDDETVRKYAVWAFAQGGKNMFEKLSNRIDFNKLDDGQKKWFYTCLFGDECFIEKNELYVKEILKNNIPSCSKSVREGAVNGLIKSGYLNILSDDIFGWFESSFEDDETIQMLLFEYLSRFYYEDKTFVDIFESLLNNMETLPPKLKLVVQNFKCTKEGRRIMMENRINIEKNYGAINIIENIENVEITPSNYAEVLENIQHSIDDLNKTLNSIDKYFIKEQDFGDLISNLEYLLKDEMENIKDTNISNNQAILNQLYVINDSVCQLKISNDKLTLGKILEYLANFTTICASVNAPEIVEFIKSFVSSIKGFITM